MARQSRRNHSLAFKAKVAVAAIKGEKTMIAPAQGFDVHPDKIKQWRDQLLEGATGMCGETPEAALGHKISPYLHQKLPITRPNQVWGRPAGRH